jgi:hypothetical protein
MGRRAGIEPIANDAYPVKATGLHRPPRQHLRLAHDLDHCISGQQESERQLSIPMVRYPMFGSLNVLVTIIAECNS